MIRFVLIAISLIFATGCTRHFTPPNIVGDTNEYEIIVCEEKLLLDIAYAVIKKQLPYTTISVLGGNEIGYSFYTLAFVDRTDYQLILQKIEGESNNYKIVGYTYTINSHGSQWAIGTAYVDPIMDNIQQALKDKKVKIVPVKSIKLI
jgi:hypothetical protein